MLIWHKELWLIDHGAALYFHHSWDNWEQQAQKPFFLVKDHVLLPWATELEQVHEEFMAILDEQKIEAVIKLIPDDWLEEDSNFHSRDEHRKAYARFLAIRLSHSAIFLKEAQHARSVLI